MKKSIMFLFMVISILCFAQFEWTSFEQIGSAGEDGGYGITVDSEENVIVVGAVSGDFSIGGVDYENQGDSDFVVVKYDSEGNVLWSHSGGSNSEDICYKVITDSMNNVYICGHFGGYMNVFGTEFNTEATREIMVAKLLPDGTPDWFATTSATSGTSNHAYGITINNSNIYITGDFDGTVSFGDTEVSGEEDIYIAKLSLDGTWLNVFTSGGDSGNEAGESLAMDSNNNIYMLGHVYGDTNIGGTDFSCAGYADIVLVKLNENLEMDWFQTAGGTSLDMGFGVTIDTNDNIFITGMFRNSGTFGDLQLDTVGGYDGFISRLDTEGNWIWTKQAGSNSHEILYGITSFNNEILVAGRGRNTVTCDTLTYESNGDEDVIFAKLDSDGNYIWLNGGGSTEQDNAIHVTASESGNIYITGFFMETATFGEQTYTSEGDKDMFLINLWEEIIHPLDPNFEVSNTTGNAPTQFQFNDLSEGNPTAWEWDFENDGIVDSNEQNPTHVYTEEGTYSVTLKIYRGEEMTEITMTDYILIGAPVMEEIISVSVDSLSFTYENPQDETFIITNISPVAIDFTLSHNVVEYGIDVIELSPISGTIEVGANQEILVDYLEIIGRVIIEGDIVISTDFGDESIVVEAEIEVNNDNEAIQPFTNLRIYPNPFNPTTNIAFNLNKTQNVDVIIYNLKGQLVNVLQSGALDKGNHVITWKGNDNKNNKVSSGIYFSEIKTKDKVYRKKMVLLK